MINSSQNELFYLYLTIFSIVFQRFFSKSVKKEAVLSSSTASGHETFFCASSFLRLCASAFVRFCFCALLLFVRFCFSSHLRLCFHVDGAHKRSIAQRMVNAPV